MDRRDFIRTTSTLLAGASLAGRALGEAAGTNGAPGRMILPINRGWRFSPKAVEGGHEKHFDDSSLERVVIPHTNKRLPWHGFDEKEYEFVSLYRRRFKVPNRAKGHRVFVDFEGVMTAATVYVNGVRLGEYKGGYTPFSFELTPHLDWEGENVLAIDIDSTERPDIPPFGYEIDYLTFGGIYREVSLRVVPETYIENIFVRPKNVLSGKPSADIECFLENAKNSKKPLVIEIELLDGNQTIAKVSQKLPTPPRKTTNPATEASASSSYVLSLNDLAGIKLRMPPGEFWQFLGESIGVNPTPVAFTEVFESLEDLLDGIDRTPLKQPLGRERVS